MDANKFIVTNAPEKICYIPDFITKEEENFLLEKIYSAPKPKWETLTNRRLQQWGGVVGKKSLISDNNIPDWLAKTARKICDVRNAFPDSRIPNHILINEYLPGQGIMPHTDGPAFFPLVSTISIGSHTLLNFYKHIKRDEVDIEHRELVGSMLLMPRSLVLISEEAYAECLHGISEVTSDKIDENVLNKPDDLPLGTILERSTRISLTIRNVPVVNRNLFAGKPK